MQWTRKNLHSVLAQQSGVLVSVGLSGMTAQYRSHSAKHVNYRGNYHMKYECEKLLTSVQLALQHTSVAQALLPMETGMRNEMEWQRCYPNSQEQHGEKQHSKLLNYNS